MSGQSEHLEQMQSAGEVSLQGDLCPVAGCDFRSKGQRSLDAHIRVKHPELIPSSDDPKKAPENADRIFYISLRPQLRTFRPSRMAVVKGPMGQNVTQQVSEPVKLSFDKLASGKGMFILDEAKAKAHRMTMAELKELIESDSDFQTGLIWVGSAGEFAQKGPNLQRGVRSR